MHIATLVLITVSFVLLASPLVWVACINVVGLKRLSQRIDYLEDDADAIRNKSRSLQSQLSKKFPGKTDFENDQEIGRKIESHIRSDVDPPTDGKIFRGGIRDASGS